MNILVTGGAGYIGSNLVKKLCDQGHKVLVLDDFSTGHRWAVDSRADTLAADLLERSSWQDRVTQFSPEVVFHIAGKAYVSDSYADPLGYYATNTIATFELLKGLPKVQNLIFSSSGSVYGDHSLTPLQETATTQPTHPYGRTKLAAEFLLKDWASQTGTPTTVLRYFNVVGANLDAQLGQVSARPSRLIECAARFALGTLTTFAILGDEFPTPDGTAVRDFIHVEDLVEAHILALKRPKTTTYNVGYGVGYSVREVLATIEKLTQKKLHIEIRPRRPGDPACLIADATKIREELGWTPRYANLEDLCRSTLNWEQMRPAADN